MIQTKFIYSTLENLYRLNVMLTTFTLDVAKVRAMPEITISNIWQRRIIKGDIEIRDKFQEMISQQTPESERLFKIKELIIKASSQYNYRTDSLHKKVRENVDFPTIAILNNLNTLTNMMRLIDIGIHDIVFEQSKIKTKNMDRYQIVYCAQRATHNCTLLIFTTILSKELDNYIKNEKLKNSNDWLELIGTIIDDIHYELIEARTIENGEGLINNGIDFTETIKQFKHIPISLYEAITNTDLETIHKFQKDIKHGIRALRIDNESYSDN